MSDLSARVDDLRMALHSLTAHKLRSALTILGIVIGVFAVTLLMALTTGLQKQIDSGLGGLGADVFQIQRFPAVNFGPLNPEVRRRKPLQLKQALALRDMLEDAKQVGAEVWDGGKEVTHAAQTARGVQVAGGTVEFFSNNGLNIGRGRPFNEGEASSPTHVTVLGAQVAERLFPDGDALGQRVRLGQADLEVVGVLEKQGSGAFGGSGGDQLVAIPIPLFLELYGGTRSVNITVMARQHDQMHKLQDEAIAAFRRVRGLGADQLEDFDVYSNESMQQVMDRFIGLIAAGTLVICLMALLVGGIGIMNIMLVAVAERTREIGLRKALGARKGRIMSQFVIEAVMLSLLGGLVGLALGGFFALVVRASTGLPANVPGWAVALALGVSSTVGLVAGIYPASRAAQLDPAISLRDE